jgi:hypothetical protein
MAEHEILVSMKIREGYNILDKVDSIKVEEAIYNLKKYTTQSKLDKFFKKWVKWDKQISKEWELEFKP